MVDDDDKQPNRVSVSSEPRRGRFQGFFSGLLLIGFALIGLGAIVYSILQHPYFSQQLAALYGTPTPPDNAATNTRGHVDHIRPPQRASTAAGTRGTAPPASTSAPCDKDRILQEMVAQERAAAYGRSVDIANRYEKQCGLDSRIVIAKTRALDRLSQYAAIVDVTSRYLEFDPLDIVVTAQRARAYERLQKNDLALLDFSRSRGLLGNPANIHGSVFVEEARVLAKLGRSCDAANLVEQYVSYDTRRLTPEVEVIIKDFRERGSCLTPSPDVVEEVFRRDARDNVIYVDVQINGVPSRFVLDTGASVTTMTHDFAKRAGIAIDNRKKVKMTTANGEIDAYEAVAKRVTARRLAADNVPAAVLPENIPDVGKGSEGLLGLSFLSRFDLRLDGTDGAARISRRSTSPTTSNRPSTAAAAPYRDAALAPKGTNPIQTEQQVRERYYRSIMESVTAGRFDQNSGVNSGKLVNYEAIKERKALVACVEWPSSANALPIVHGSVVAQAAEHEGDRRSTTKLREEALDQCKATLERRGCRCATIDENGKAVVRIPENLFSKQTNGQ